jgi:type IV secretion system protein VirB10
MTQTDGAESPEPRKVEQRIERELRLRAEPPKVLRISRKAIAFAVGVAAIGLSAALYVATKPREKNLAQEQVRTEGRSTPAEGVTSLPRDYSAIPKLGPPLPGDFGRPLLRQSQEAEARAGDPVAARPSPDPEQQQRAQALAQARTSSLFSQASRSDDSRVAIDGSPSVETPPQPATPPLTTQTSDYDLSAHANTRLAAGTLLSAALITAIHSDLPGQVIAQITEPVRDTSSGSLTLIPQGSRVIGEYDTTLRAGQSRVFVVWTRLIYPDGRSITLDRFPATDAVGRTGLADRTDFHWAGVAKAAAVSTLLSVAAQSGSTGDEGDIARALRDGASDSVARTGRQIVERELGRSPTITIRAGHPVRILLTKDLDLRPAAAG